MSDLQNFQIPNDMPLTVTLTLTAQHWAGLQRYLDQGPHGLVRPLLEEIQRQCMAQAMREQQRGQRAQRELPQRQDPLPEHMPMRVTGGMSGGPMPGNHDLLPE